MYGVVAMKIVFDIFAFRIIVTKYDAIASCPMYTFLLLLIMSTQPLPISFKRSN
jgi:hypothetical protein